MPIISFGNVIAEGSSTVTVENCDFNNRSVHPTYKLNWTCKKCGAWLRLKNMTKFGRVSHFCAFTQEKEMLEKVVLKLERK